MGDGALFAVMSVPQFMGQDTTDLHSTPHAEHAIIRDLRRQPLQRLLNNIILLSNHVVGATTPHLYQHI